MDETNTQTHVAGRYRLDDKLGEGGFGTVHRAWDTVIGRDVAIKLFDPSKLARNPTQEQELVDRFFLEARTAGQINHPNIVTIYDLGSDEADRLYIAMELLDGHDLDAELRHRAPLDAARVQRLFVPVLEALGKGHARGIVHKDLKPANLFLCEPGTSDERLQIVDFGIARTVHEQRLTMTGQIVGTPQYLAPEYIRGTEVAPVMDVYQMGLIIAEALGNRPVVPADEAFVVACNRHVQGDLDIADAVRTGPFWPVLQRALAMEPRDRFQSGTEMASALAEVEVGNSQMRVSHPTPAASRAAQDVDAFGQTTATPLPEDVDAFGQTMAGAPVTPAHPQATQPPAPQPPSGHAPSPAPSPAAGPETEPSGLHTGERTPPQRVPTAEASAGGPGSVLLYVATGLVVVLAVGAAVLVGVLLARSKEDPAPPPEPPAAAPVATEKPQIEPEAFAIELARHAVYDSARFGALVAEGIKDADDPVERTRTPKRTKRRTSKGDERPEADEKAAAKEAETDEPDDGAEEEETATASEESSGGDSRQWDKPGEKEKTREWKEPAAKKKGNELEKERDKIIDESVKIRDKGKGFLNDLTK